MQRLLLPVEWAVSEARRFMQVFTINAEPSVCITCRITTSPRSSRGKMIFIPNTVLLMHEVSPERGQPCCHLQGWPCPAGHTAAGCCGSRHIHPWGTYAPRPHRCTSSPLSPSSHTPCAVIAWHKSDLCLTCTTPLATGQLHLMLDLLHMLYVLAGACH